MFAFDCEVYKNYTLFLFRGLADTEYVRFELRTPSARLSDRAWSIPLQSLLERYTVFGFNSINYDIPVMLYALDGKNANDIYLLSKKIISEGKPGWETLRELGLTTPNSLKHVDLMGILGRSAGLKLYGARLNSKVISNLPYDPDAYLTVSQKIKVEQYCQNDVNITIDIYNSVKSRVDLRFLLSDKYGVDFNSMSDVQIAESIIKLKLKLNDRYLKSRVHLNGEKHRYKLPEIIKFKNIALVDLACKVESCVFHCDDRGSLVLPETINDLDITIGNSRYKLGIGGLHSQEKAQSKTPASDYILIEKDVVSFYPNIILNLGLYPKSLGPGFLNVYSKMLKDRLEAKKNGDNTVNSYLKIVLNGTFGKFGSKYSFLYSPETLLSVTLTGQFLLLMLIDNLEHAGISVISANTDGVVCLFHKRDLILFQDLCSEWEKHTNFTLEETVYSSLYSKDVNNYIASVGKGFKGRGMFSEPGLRKNPHARITIDAAAKFLFDGKPISDTVRGCKDVTKFIFARMVKGGADFVPRGRIGKESLGPVVRWVWSTDGGVLKYTTNGHKVPKSDGGLPVMRLGRLPKSIDYDRYIDETKSILDSVGYISETFELRGYYGA